MKDQTTAFLLLFRNCGPDTHDHLSPEQRDVLTRQWNDWVQGLVTQGKLAHGSPLGLDGRVVTGTTGGRVTDGPYAEGKEIVGGYVLIHAADLDEATAVARQCPGLSVNLVVEVRPLLAFSPVLEGVQAHPIKPA